jgi:hypothetical protein
LSETLIEEGSFYGFPTHVLQLAANNQYDLAELAMVPYLGEEIAVAQRLMNMRLQRKFLEKQGKIAEAGRMATDEVHVAVTTDDPVLISNVISSVAVFALRNSTYQSIGQLVHLQRSKVVPLMEDVDTPFMAINITSANSILVSVCVRSLLRAHTDVPPAERAAVNELILAEAPALLDTKLADFLHLLQVDGKHKPQMMPFSRLLAHYEFAEFERRLKREHHYGNTPEQWLAIARQRAVNLSDTSMGTSAQDSRRQQWLTVGTLLPGHEGAWDGGDGSLNSVESYRLAMILRAQIQQLRSVPERAKLLGEVRAVEDRFGYDWPFYEDEGIISDYF